MTMPLDGVKMLDLSRLGPGPYGSMLLADMGAEVIMIEEAGRMTGRRAGMKVADSRRGDATPEGRRTAALDALGRNKRSLRVNLKTEEGKAIFYRLAELSDVVLEGFRPGVVKRLGVDYETLKARNPRLIYCSLSGYGQDGPYAQYVGHDLNYIGIAGALGMIGREGSPPAIPVNFIGDYGGGGMMVAWSICLALLARERTGGGQYIDVAMTEGVMSLMTAMGAMHFAKGDDYPPESFWGNGGEPFYNVYATKDGKWISVGAMETWFYANLCRALGREDLIAYHEEIVEYDLSKDTPERRQVFEAFREAFKTKTRDEWFQILTAADVPAGPVYAMSEAVRDPHHLHRQIVVEVDAPGGGKVKQIGIVPKLSETPGQIRHVSPYPGEHGEAILGELGFDAATIAAYQEREIV